MTADTDANSQVSSSYWDDVADHFGQHDPSATWRAYMQAAYRDLMQRWFASAPPGRTLKTDLFEEAVSAHNLFQDLGADGVGLDVSPAVVRAAAKRCADANTAQPARVLVADLRSLPFATASFQRILSGSSLDHFEDKRDIAIALGDLARTLAPGGCLVITFDNPHNPLISLRNGLPFGFLRAIGLVPYFVGATYGRRDVERELAAVGLRITHVSAIVHVPRAPAIWIATMFERWRGPHVSKWLIGAFRAWDRLESTALRFRTGYYLAVRAEKVPPR